MAKASINDSSFKDPTTPKEGLSKSKKSPWEFTCPVYDERSSCFVNAGGEYGVGHRNPVGHSTGVKQHVPTLPFGKHSHELPD